MSELGNVKQACAALLSLVREEFKQLIADTNKTQAHILGSFQRGRGPQAAIEYVCHWPGECLLHQRHSGSMEGR